MLEYWYKERRTMVDFRRGPLGPYFDGFAGELKQKGYSVQNAKFILSKCCFFNAYLIDNGINHIKKVTPDLIEPFLNFHFANFRTRNLSYSPRFSTQNILKRLFDYLTATGAVKPIKPKIKSTRYSWILDSYLKYLKEECELTETTIKRNRILIEPFLKGMKDNVVRKQMKNLQADFVEKYFQQHIKKTPENLQRLFACLRRFLRFCAQKGYMSKDYSGLIPPLPAHRYAYLPKGMEEGALQQMLNMVDRSTQMGARDYAIMILMMAYGIRGKQAASLQLDDISWERSTIQIRALKGGKEVLLPLLEAVGEALIKYLHSRPKTQFREVFITIKAPLKPLTSVGVSRIIIKNMVKAGVKTPKSGSSTIRHSWAIRALAGDTPIKNISDILGHRCIDTTFIYTKADLETLRQVTMPWPEGR
jgi:site-specific recombinase XerD